MHVFVCIDRYNMYCNRPLVKSGINCKAEIVKTGPAWKTILNIIWAKIKLIYKYK